MNVYEFRIGADPEVFLTDESGNLKSAIPVVEGTKHEQLMVDGGGLQRDNVAAEFSCNPTDSEDAFVEIIGKMVKQLADHVKPLRLAVIASTNFPKKELEHPEARMFGCDPDYDAYTVARNNPPEGAADGTLRSCGGHIHVGIKNGTPKILAEDDTGMGKIQMVKSMDFFVGVPSLLLDPDKSAAKRRTLYGKAGCHRPKHYGVEYRATGNFWVRSPNLVRMIYRLTGLACTSADSGLTTKYFEELGNGDVKAGEKEVQRIINTSDYKAAESFVSRFIIPNLKKETVALFDQIRNSELNLYSEWKLQ